MSATAGGDKTRRGELSEKINEAKQIKAAKRRANDGMRDLVSQIDAFETEKRQLQKFMAHNCNTVEAVNQEIKDAERRLTTTSMKASEEGKLIKEIETLKNSIPKVERYEQIDPQTKAMKA